MIINTPSFTMYTKYSFACHFSFPVLSHALNSPLLLLQALMRSVQKDAPLVLKTNDRVETAA